MEKILKNNHVVTNERSVADVLSEYADQLATETNGLIKSRIMLSDVNADPETYFIKSKTTSWYVYLPFPGGEWRKLLDVKTLEAYKEYPVELVSYFGKNESIEIEVRPDKEEKLRQQVNFCLNIPETQKFLHEFYDKAQRLAGNLT